MTISGKTALAGTIADPVDHLQAPRMMGNWFKERGIDAVWLPLHVKLDKLEQFLEAARCLENFAGFTVTMPHKIALMPLLDRVVERAQRVGAINLVWREADGSFVGDIVDGIGFQIGFEAEHGKLEGRRVWMVGAGGVARAMAFAIAEVGVRSFAIEDVMAERAEQLVADLKAAYADLSAQVGSPDYEIIDLAINATPVGMHDGDPLPFDPRVLRSDATVADVIMLPPVTPLLIEAEKHGCRTFEGRKMLYTQLDIYAEYLGLAG